MKWLWIVCSKMMHGLGNVSGLHSTHSKSNADDDDHDDDVVVAWRVWPLLAWPLRIMTTTKAMMRKGFGEVVASVGIPVKELCSLNIFYKVSAGSPPPERYNVRPEAIKRGICFEGRRWEVKVYSRVFSTGHLTT